VFHIQPEDDHYLAPKHVVVLHVINSIFTSLHHTVVLDSKVTQLEFIIEQNGDDQPYDSSSPLPLQNKSSLIFL